MSVRVLALAAVVSVIAVSGCTKPKGSVTGTVTHKGKKVVWGGVTLVASDGVVYSGQINPDGTYTIPGVPSGDVKIAVTSPDPGGSTRGGRPVGGGFNEAGGAGPGAGATNLPPPGAWFALPDKYGDPLQSGLTGTVNGDTKLDITLP
jgi:hypothetical protein